MHILIRDAMSVVLSSELSTPKLHLMLRLSFWRYGGDMMYLFLDINSWIILSWNNITI